MHYVLDHVGLQPRDFHLSGLHVEGGPLFAHFSLFRDIRNKYFVPNGSPLLVCTLLRFVREAKGATPLNVKYLFYE